jgi:hypothetical protein
MTTLLWMSSSHPVIIQSHTFHIEQDCLPQALRSTTSEGSSYHIRSIKASVPRTMLIGFENPCKYTAQNGPWLISNYNFNNPRFGFASPFRKDPTISSGQLRSFPYTEVRERILKDWFVDFDPCPRIIIHIFPNTLTKRVAPVPLLSYWLINLDVSDAAKERENRPVTNM